ncbi:hypothetical protein L9F63_025471, partial [Diploptera punctata]
DFHPVCVSIVCYRMFWKVIFRLGYHPFLTTAFIPQLISLTLLCHLNLFSFSINTIKIPNPDFKTLLKLTTNFSYYSFLFFIYIFS